MANIVIVRMAESYIIDSHLFVFFYILEVLADGVTILDPYKESFLAFIL
nr:MAG: hypothetical protein [Bacteriophage sp.]